MMSGKLYTRAELVRSGFRKIGEFVDSVRKPEDPANVESSSSSNGLLHDDRDKNRIAVINRKTCLSWSTGTICDICIHRCPEHAIEFVLDKKPVIIRSKCNGCGMCRHICPADPKAVEMIYADRELI